MLRLSSLRFLLSMILVVWGSASIAQDALMQERAKSLYLELRCVVCQNQSIGDSDADVAKDLREIVMEQMISGKSNAQIKQFLVDRYGEFILLKPVWAWHTAALWLSPILLLLVGGFLIFKSRSVAPFSPRHKKLSNEEEKRIAELLKDND